MKGLPNPRRDLEFYFSPFVRYPLSRTVSAIVYSGILQLGHDYGKPAGLKNYPVNIETGIKWDFSISGQYQPLSQFHHE